jgi:hypothetical protein
MGGLAEWWAIGGMWMYVVLLTDFAVAMLLGVLFVFAVVSAVTRRLGSVARALAIVGLLSTLTPLCAGFVGKQAGLNNMEQAIVHVDPEQREVIRAVGTAEAGVPFRFGIGSVCLLFGGAMIVLVTGFVAASRAPNPDAEEEA